jgi:signal transduction histidine kinase
MPVRFVWQTDEQGRFTLASEDFIGLVGGRTAALLGCTWTEIAEALQLDPEGQVAQALATQDTWSALTVSWPAQTSDRRLAVELSGLPVFDRKRTFRGYRGFGICRNAAAVARAMVESNTAPSGAPKHELELQAVMTAQHPRVVRLRVGNDAESPAPSLSPAEHEAFREISRKLGEGVARPTDEPADIPANGDDEDSAAQLKYNTRERARERRGAERRTDIQAMLDRIPAGILIYQLNGLLYANPTFLRWSGHESVERLIEAGGLDELFIEPLAAAQAPGAGIMTVKLDRGDNLPLECELVNIIWDGEPAHALLALSSPGEDVRLLIEAKHRAEIASTAKSEFLAQVSHELRTPLNSIIGFAELMIEERFGAVGNDRYREYLKDIRDSGAHLLSLANDLLDLAKIEAGRVQLAFASVDLNELVRQCVGLMQPQAQHARVIMRSSPAPLPLHIWADLRSVRQMLFNLLSNSLKFTPAGGQVIVSTSVNEGGETVLRVRDTGTGMSAKQLQGAFDKTAQTSSLPNEGAGLGLPLTKALAEANRAGFRLTSTPGSGTLAEIVFPAGPAPSDHPAAVQPQFT